MSVAEEVARMADGLSRQWNEEALRLAAGQGNPFPEFAASIRERYAASPAPSGCSAFREALAKLRFLDLPTSINFDDYGPTLARDWGFDPVRAFFRLTDADQEKVWAEIGSKL